MSDKKLFTPEEVEIEGAKARERIRDVTIGMMDALSEEKRLEVIQRYCRGCGMIQGAHPQGYCNCQRDE